MEVKDRPSISRIETQTNGEAICYRFKANGCNNIDAKIRFNVLSTDRISKYITKS